MQTSHAWRCSIFSQKVEMLHFQGIFSLEIILFTISVAFIKRSDLVSNLQHYTAKLGLTGGKPLVRGGPTRVRVRARVNHNPKPEKAALL